ncbi:tRNA lysidine(34) synthetase TilS [Columbia Basin potato purple top phytoplasma]|uniref:tRNA(Ile)-lysidine synthase n=1 Tax=Columbia Basin potato purple top phytoplasma TaxID=307134 RepID=A0ABT5L7Y2_9MOLU|nr:tRNA lysidine(34) synthetase TilS [Columbia Basin potato purple top phytoplasma]MDC9031810.1 tRNA lysidine(34) synthetase TilS [Columbia Basin potato purple top phytoplasma]
MIFSSLCLKFDKKNTYIISVSGGVDSMVLLDYLYNSKYNLIVVNFNHLKRKDSLKDKILIEKYCCSKQISFYYFELNIKEKNFQNEARLLRQEKLKQIALKHKTNYIITAHHLDDLAETILFKIARGSSILGYSGMQTSYFNNGFYFLKPLLYIPKQEIVSYASNKKITFLEDYTNNLNIYTRNKIRNQIIPCFKEINNFLKNIKKFHLQMTEINMFIRKQTHDFLEKKQNNFCFNLKSFLKLDIVIQKDIILFLLEEKKINKNFDLINNIIKGLQNDQKSNITWNSLSSEWLFIKQYNKFFWQTKQRKQEKNNKFLKPLLYYSNKKDLLSFCCLIQKILYDPNNIKPPFFLRKRQPGDILRFSFGKQKLKKFFINLKIPLTERDKIWLVVDQQNIIIWIPNLYLNSTLGQKKYLYFGLKKEK